MSPIIKKTSFRMKKLKHPLKPGKKRKAVFTRGLKRGIVAIFMSLLTIGVIYYGKLPVRTTLNEGDIATEDIYAPFSFSYETGIDEEKTKGRKQRALEKVLDIYNIDATFLEGAEADISQFFDELVSLKESGIRITDADIEKIKTKLAITIGPDDIRALLRYPEINLLKENTILILKGVYLRPIISDETRKDLLDSDKDKTLLYQKSTGEETTKKVAELHDVSECRTLIELLLLKSDIDDRKIRAILHELIFSQIKPNFVFNAKETEAARREALSSIVPVYNIAERSKGEVIIRKGQRVTKDHLIQLGKISIPKTVADIVSQFCGIVVIMSLLIFLMYIYLNFFEPEIFHQDKLLLLIGLLILFTAISARVIVSSPLPSYFIPVAAVSMLLTILFKGSVAAIATMAAATIVALIAGAKFNIFMVSMVGGMSAICTVYRARHRSQIIKSGVYVGILNFITISAIGILSNFETLVFLKEGLWGIASGITAAAITMIFLPIFESAFKLTTDIKLVELADLNHPLLKDMVMNAAGTYHHSLIVGNLSEAAADAIGANSLLARVGSYYHDIGKIQKAEYFAENQRDPLEMHDKLAPSMSSLIITNHVKDGIELAEKYKLGNAIKDIIEQHHGSGLMTYFYHQAIEKTQQVTEKPLPENVVSEESFRYPGPKPQTKESAIVMLADSAEAASRVLQNPTPQRLKELVRKIINNKFIDRQLDECDLTLKDINKISDCFVRALTGIYHSRIEYPSGTKSKHADNNHKRPKKDKA